MNQILINVELMYTQFKFIYIMLDVVLIHLIERPIKTFITSLN